MNHFKGWIKLYRSLSEKGWYVKSEYVHLWVHLLMKANHKDAEFWFNGANIKIKRGQMVTGRKALSRETGISESKIERILKCFESEQQIEQQTNNRSRLISISYFDKYQATEQPTTQQTDSNRTTDEQQADTNKNANNNNNNKEQRELTFREQVAQHTTYESSMLDSFADYWTESNEKGKKMKFEMQKTFDIVRRLKAWSNNGFDNKKPADKLDIDNTKDSDYPSII